MAFEIAFVTYWRLLRAFGLVTVVWRCLLYWKKNYKSTALSRQHALDSAAATPCGHAARLAALARSRCHYKKYCYGVSLYVTLPNHNT